LREWQGEAFRDADLVPVSSIEAPCLVVPDTLFATGGGLRAFVEGAAGRDAVLVLKRSLFGKSTTPVQPRVTEVEEGWRFEGVRFVSGKRLEPVDVVVDPEEKVFELPVPRTYMGADKIEVGIARHPVMTLHHWVHILWANQNAGGIEMRVTPGWKMALRGLWAAIRAFSFNKWKVLRKLNHKGRGCDIHPTAVVEGSRLGDGVKIGPHARVLFSTLGDGACVMTGAQVELCVLGERTLVSDQTVVRLCVLYPEAVASQYLMQQCVLGRQAVTTGGGFTMDLNWEQDIRVPLDGELHDTGQRFLGAAFGHRSRIGTGFWLASGRMVPNDYLLVRDPERVLTKLPDDLKDAGPLVADGKRLRPLK
jgi:carbonic anhydrase/acetyltransferase-like protein (isoleucine patch superfamily)